MDITSSCCRNTRRRQSTFLEKYYGKIHHAAALFQTLDDRYGCYIIGRNWFFVVLEDKEYAVSDAYVATQDDIFHIVAILRQLKTIVDEAMDKMLAEA